MLRATRFDPFALQEDRRAERAMLDAYTEDMRMALAELRPETIETAIALAEIPDSLRGFGPVKLDNWRKAQARREALRQRFTCRPANCR